MGTQESWTRDSPTAMFWWVIKGHLCALTFSYWVQRVLRKSHRNGPFTDAAIPHSSLRPVIVEPYEQLVDLDGYPEKNMFKKSPDFLKAREVSTVLSHMK